MATSTIANGSRTRSATAGFFGRINYDYKGIYLLKQNGRYDRFKQLPRTGSVGILPLVLSPVTASLKRHTLNQ